MDDKLEYSLPSDVRRACRDFPVYQVRNYSHIEPPDDLGRFNCRGDYVMPGKKMDKYIIVSNDLDENGETFKIFQSFRNGNGHEKSVKKEAEMAGISVKEVFGPGEENLRALIVCILVITE